MFISQDKLHANFAAKLNVHFQSADKVLLLLLSAHKSVSIGKTSCQFLLHFLFLGYLIQLKAGTVKG